MLHIKKRFRVLNSDIDITFDAFTDKAAIMWAENIVLQTQRGAELGFAVFCTDILEGQSDEDIPPKLWERIHYVAPSEDERGKEKDAGANRGIFVTLQLAHTNGFGDVYVISSRYFPSCSVHLQEGWQKALEYALSLVAEHHEKQEDFDPRTALLAKAEESLIKTGCFDFEGDYLDATDNEILTDDLEVVISCIMAKPCG